MVILPLFNRPIHALPRFAPLPPLGLVAVPPCRRFATAPKLMVDDSGMRFAALATTLREVEAEPARLRRVSLMLGRLW